MASKIYLSGGMKGHPWQYDVKKELKNYDVIFLDPRNHNLDDPGQYSTCDTSMVKHCDILIAYMDENNPSGIGLAYEVGLAVGLNKPVIFIGVLDRREKWFNIIKYNSSLYCDNIDIACDKLKKIYLGAI